MTFHNCAVQYRPKVGHFIPFLYHQISMSVPLILVLVMKMLIAPTVMVPTAVLVNKDSPEMVQYAKVGQNVI